MLELRLHHITQPMRSGFVHSRATRNTAEAVICTIQHDEIIGIGECVPRTYVTGESIESVIDAIMECDIDSIMSSLHTDCLDAAIHHLLQLDDEKLPPNAKTVVEMALLDYLGKKFTVSVTQIIKRYLLPENSQNHANSAFPTSQVMDMSFNVDHFIEQRQPFHYVKVKVGQDINQNVERIKMLRKKLAPSIAISIDANMAWSLAAAIENVQALSKFDIDYFEEPLAQRSWDDYRRLRQETGCKILLDESVCTLTDAQTAVDKHACDAINIRISKCGGIINATRLMQFAKQHRLGFMLGAQVAETGPLTAAGRQLAAASKNYFTFEAGQPQRFFGGRYLIEPMPVVDLETNLAINTVGKGLGVTLSQFFADYITHEYHWSNQTWTKENSCV
jgi:L-Ala-D/L-Glu epimerase